jgi:NAD(P)-dependent dehydrogenase (short-subunit alcohol dehydrogenase family)
MQIDGASVFVTGGASGLGAATVRALVARGARVAIYDLPRSKGAELEKELGPATRFLAGDVSDEGQVRDAIDAAIAAFGPLRGLVNCAGIGSASRTVGKDAEPFRLDAFPARDRREPDRHVQRDPARRGAHGRQRARR